MSAHDLKYAVLVPEVTPIGESALASARKAITGKYGVSPVEVFLDGVQSDGIVQAGDLTLDLDLLKLRLYTFGASSEGATSLTTTSAPAQPAPATDEAEATPAQQGTTTTVSTDS